MAFELIVEDGSIVDNANSYASKQQIDDFLENEGIVPPVNIYYLASKAALKMDNKYNWIGSKVSKLQSMQWPRQSMGVCNAYLATPNIPKQLITAQLYLLADALVNEAEEGVRNDQALRRKKVGNLEIEFFDSTSGVTSSSNDWVEGVRNMLSGLIGASLFSKRV